MGKLKKTSEKGEKKRFKEEKIERLTKDRQGGGFLIGWINMTKFLLISGSPRQGNTEFILKKLFESLKGKKELILLREKNIKHCLGCQACDKSNKCVISDDMQEIYEKLIKTETIIIGTPNYFNNVPGLLKDFIDRTNPFYNTDLLKGKKLIVVIAGERDKKYLKEVVKNAFSGFIKCHKLKLRGSFYFRASDPKDVASSPKPLKLIKEIANYVNKNC